MVSVANGKKSKKDFYFHERRWKAKIALFVLQWALAEAAGTLSRESGTTKLLPWELHAVSQHQAPIAVDCVCEHLGFRWVYFMCLLARCVLRKLLLHFMPFQLKRVSKEHSTFQQQETCPLVRFLLPKIKTIQFNFRRKIINEHKNVFILFLRSFKIF